MMTRINLPGINEYAGTHFWRQIRIVKQAHMPVKLDPAHVTAEGLIKESGLEILSIEGGHFRQAYRAEETVPVMAPGYVDEDYIHGDRGSLIRQYPDRAELIMSLTREAKS